MERIVEESGSLADTNPTNTKGDSVAVATPSGDGSGHSPLETLTSGQKLDLRGGSIQAHICVVTCQEDVAVVMDAFHQADAFREVVSWSYAYRIPAGPQPAVVVDLMGSVAFSSSSGRQPRFDEGCEDGLDEGCGDKILAVLERMALHGLLLVISRWQEYGATSGLELFGTMLYVTVTERCKDLIAQLRKAAGMSENGPLASVFSSAAEQRRTAKVQSDKAPWPPPRKNFDFGYLPPLPEPKQPMRFGPNHYMSEMPLTRPTSLPCLFSGGDVRLWMENDRCLRELPDSELWALRSLRHPDERVEQVLQAVATIRGQKVVRTGTPAARWGHCLQVLRSPTFRTELLLIDAGAIPLEAAHAASQLLSGLKVDDLRRTSPAAAALFEWAQGAVRWRLEGPPPVEGSDEVPYLPLRSRELRPAGLQQCQTSPARLRVGPPRCLRRRFTGSLSSIGITR